MIHQLNNSLLEFEASNSDRFKDCSDVLYQSETSNTQSTADNRSHDEVGKLQHFYNTVSVISVISAISVISVRSVVSKIHFTFLDVVFGFFACMYLSLGFRLQILLILQKYLGTYY